MIRGCVHTVISAANRKKMAKLWNGGKVMYPFDGVLQMKQDCITRIFGNVATMQHEMMYPCHDKFCQWEKMLQNFSQTGRQQQLQTKDVSVLWSPADEKQKLQNVDIRRRQQCIIERCFPRCEKYFQWEKGVENMGFAER